jgi:hypothetical protein
MLPVQGRGYSRRRQDGILVKDTWRWGTRRRVAQIAVAASMNAHFR